MRVDAFVPPPPRTGEVDLLFLVDNSGSMGQEQESLTAQFPRLVQVLTSGDFDRDGRLGGPDDFEPVTDLNVGIITSDMGTAGFTVNTCFRADFGDDGILRTQGRADIAGCMASYPSFLSFRPDAGGEAVSFARDLSCVAMVGTGGCGFEQQLEASLKALSPVGPTEGTASDYVPPTFFGGTFGHGDGANDGFVRRDSVLAVIVVTDEDDCSASDGELFNSRSATYRTTNLDLRCFVHGEAALHPISRYVDGLLRLRRHPSRLVYALIAGVPVDLVTPSGSPEWDLLVGPSGTRDPRMEEQIDPMTLDRLVPSCDEPGRGTAYPPIRLLRVGRDLEARGAGVTVQSICQDDYSAVIRAVIRRVAD